MKGPYDFLKVYAPGGNEVNDNWFSPLEELEITSAEQKLGQRFPEELRRFYQDIGTGMLRSPHIRPEGYEFYGKNEILPPYIAVDYSQGILEHPDDEFYYMAESAYEDLTPGDLPFFEIGDSSSFMVMKLHSDNPNAVWFMGAEKIEDSFEQFIYKLYYEGPNYYHKYWT